MKNVPVYSIDSGVPVPPERRNLHEEYPLNQLSVGESILFPRVDRNRVQVFASQLKRKTGKSFTVRVQDESNCRVWRTA